MSKQFVSFPPSVVTIDGGELVLITIERIDDPPSLAALKAAVTARLQRVDLPELPLKAIRRGRSGSAMSA